MSKENIIKVLDSYGVLSTFKPKKGETIILTIDPNKIDIITGREWLNLLGKLYPKNQVLIKLDGMNLESLMEDDLK